MDYIKTKQEYDQAIKRLGQVFYSDPGTQEGDEAKILGIRIEQYEDCNCPIPDEFDYNETIINYK